MRYTVKKQVYWDMIDILTDTSSDRCLERQEWVFMCVGVML